MKTLDIPIECVETNRDKSFTCNGDLKRCLGFSDVIAEGINERRENREPMKKQIKLSVFRLWHHDYHVCLNRSA